MINNIFQLLGIGVNGQVYETTLSKEDLAIIAQQNHEKAVWIVVLVAILIGILYFVFAHSKVKQKLSKFFADKKSKKAIKLKNEELSKIHRKKTKKKHK